MFAQSLKGAPISILRDSFEVIGCCNVSIEMKMHSHKSRVVALFQIILRIPGGLRLEEWLPPGSSTSSSVAPEGEHEYTKAVVEEVEHDCLNLNTTPPVMTLCFGFFSPFPNPGFGSPHYVNV